MIEDYGVSGGEIVARAETSKGMVYPGASEHRVAFEQFFGNRARFERKNASSEAVFFSELRIHFERRVTRFICLRKEVGFVPGKLVTSIAEHFI